jgi:hypothetical protein
LIAPPEPCRAPVRKLFIMNRTAVNHTTAGSVITAKRHTILAGGVDSRCPTQPVTLVRKMNAELSIRRRQAVASVARVSPDGDHPGTSDAPPMRVHKAATSIRRLRLPQIRTNAGTQTRVEVDADAVADYAEAMIAGDRLPPVVVFFDGRGTILADGFHRIRAARQARFETATAPLSVAPPATRCMEDPKAQNCKRRALLAAPIVFGQVRDLVLILCKSPGVKSAHARTRG